MRRPCCNRDGEEDSENTELDKDVVEGRWIGFRKQSSDGRIDITLSNDPFDLKTLSRCPPTGQEGPPPEVKEGVNTFYYYGAGGGGVEYPDRFFYNFRGKTIYVVFDGPYDGKSPNLETRQIEHKILASFRTFQPASDP